MKSGIRVNAVVHGEVLSAGYQLSADKLPRLKGTNKPYVRRSPLGNRMTTKEEIADMVAFLLSPCSSHTIGEIVFVDGGYAHLDRAISLEG